MMQTLISSPHQIVTKESEILSRHRVLCVEDDRDTCEVLRFIMTDYEFTTVHSVAEAEQFIAQGDYDLYVLDNWLPDGSGVELCQKIRSSGNTAPIIFTSAIGQRKDIEIAMNAGADRYIIKPYEPENLVRTVKELIDSRRRADYPLNREI